ncbi:MAG: NUDIX domain-containing protein [Candidatus Nomurabacteria bacterium]
MEYLDICDSEGNLLGNKELKTEVHRLGLWHRSVHVWILNSKEELLIQKRSPIMDNYPNEWDVSTAGHVSAGEDFITSAIRETKEEIGLKISKEDFNLIGTIKQTSSREGYINNEINPIYIVKMDLDPKELVKQKDEVTEVKFIKINDLKEIIEKKDPTFVQRTEEYKLLFNYLNNLK